MKKKLLIGFIIILFATLFTVKAQDTSEINYAKKVYKAMKDRPNPEMFSEDEAWKVMTGEERTSKDYKVIQTEYKWFSLMKKENISFEFYNRSETSSRDGWWYTNTRSWEPGTWKIDYMMALVYLASLFGLLCLYKIWRASKESAT